MRISLRALRWTITISLIFLIVLGIPQEVVKSWLLNYFPRDARYYIIPPFNLLIWNFEGVYLTGDAVASLLSKVIVYGLVLLTFPLTGRIILYAIRLLLGR